MLDDLEDTVTAMPELICDSGSRGNGSSLASASFSFSLSSCVLLNNSSVKDDDDCAFEEEDRFAVTAAVRDADSKILLLTRLSVLPTLLMTLFG
jgi:hypothetical protein